MCVCMLGGTLSCCVRTEADIVAYEKRCLQLLPQCGCVSRGPSSECAVRMIIHALSESETFHPVVSRGEWRHRG